MSEIILTVGSGNSPFPLYGDIMTILAKSEANGGYVAQNLNPWALLGEDPLFELYQQLLTYLGRLSSPIIYGPIVEFPVPNYVIIGQSNFKSSLDMNGNILNPDRYLEFRLSSIGPIQFIEVDFNITDITGWAITETYIQLYIVIWDDTGTQHEFSYDHSTPVPFLSFRENFKGSYMITTPNLSSITPDSMSFICTLTSPSNIVLAQLNAQINATIKLTLP